MPIRNKKTAASALPQPNFQNLSKPIFFQPLLTPASKVFAAKKYHNLL
jgi:hypothetical protein